MGMRSLGEGIEMAVESAVVVLGLCFYGSRVSGGVKV